MSPPDTNTKKQAKRHKPPLIGIVGVVLFALVLLGLLAMYVAGRGNDPANSTPISVETESDTALSEQIDLGTDAQED